MSSNLRRYQYGDFTAAEREQIRQSDVNAAVNFRQSHFNNAVRFPFKLTEDELNQLSEIYTRDICLMAGNHLRRSSHVIPAAMLWRATTEFYREAIGHDGNRRFIDIGGSVARVLGQKNAHGCLLSDTGRDRFRYLSTINSKLRSTNMNDLNTKNAKLIADLRDLQFDVFNDAAADAHVSTSDQFCLQGSQCCDFRATFAVSIHSLYAITPKQVYDTFVSHGLETMLAVLYLPQEMRYGDKYALARAYEKKYNFYDYQIHPTRPEMSVLSFRDNSLVYVQRTDTWSNWFYVTRIAGDEFDIIIEDYEQNGPEHRLRFTRVPRGSSEMIPRMLQPELLADYIEFPDLHSYILNGFINDQDEIEHLLIPAEFHRKAMNQALKPEMLSNSSVHTYIVGITNRIDINTVEINHKFIIDPITLQKYAYSMLFVAAARRLVVSDEAKAVYKYIASNQSEMCPFDNFVDRLKVWWKKFSSFGHRTNHHHLANFVARTFKPELVDRLVSVRTFYASQIVGSPTVLPTPFDDDFVDPDVVDSDDEDNPPAPQTGYHARPLMRAETVDNLSVAGDDPVTPRLTNITRATLHTQIKDKHDQAPIKQTLLPPVIVPYVNPTIPFNTLAPAMAFSLMNNLMRRTRPQSPPVVVPVVVPPVTPVISNAATVVSTTHAPAPLTPTLPVVLDRQIIGQSIYDRVVLIDQPRAARIVGMFVALADAELMSIHDDDRVLATRVLEAQKLLDSKTTTTSSSVATSINLPIVTPADSNNQKCCVCDSPVFIACEKCHLNVCQEHIHHCSYVNRNERQPPFRTDRVAMNRCNHVERAHFEYSAPLYVENLPVSYDMNLSQVGDEKYNEIYQQLPSTIYAGNARGATKLQQILSSCDIQIPSDSYVADIGAGPGYCAAVFYENYGCAVDGYEHPSIHITKNNRSNYTNIYNFDYNTFKTPRHFSKYSFIHCDIQDPVITNQPDRICQIILAMSTGSSISIKLHSPSQSDIEKQRSLARILTHAADHFNHVTCIKPSASPELSHEFYLVCRNRREPRMTCTICINKLRSDIWFLENKRLCAVRDAVHGCFADVYDRAPTKISIHDSDIRVTDAEIFAYRTDLLSVRLSNRINRAIAEVVVDLFDGPRHHVNPIVRAKFVTGIFGCGKTTFYKQNCDRTDLIITPTDQLCAELRRSKLPAVTEHVAFTHNRVVRRLFIDEAYTFYPGKIALFNTLFEPSEIYLVGDPLQIPSIDFTACKAYTGCRTLQQIYDHVHNQTSHTAPHDVTRLMRNFGYPEAKTTSRIVRSITTHSTTLEKARDIARRLGWPVISYNQTRANAFGENSCTVHESVGLRHRNVILYIDPHAVETGFTRSFGHVRVALSRHTDNLLIVGDADGLFRTAFYVNSAFDRNAALFDQEHSNVDYEHAAPLAPSVYVDTSMQYDKCSVDTASTILDDMIVTRLAENDNFGSIQAVINNNKGRRTLGSKLGKVSRKNC